MKKIFLVCALITSVSLVSYAQQAGVSTAPVKATSTYPATHNPTATELGAAKTAAEKNTKALQAKLKLTKDQYTAVYDVEYRFESYCKKYPENNVPAGALSNITSERNRKLGQILTPEQLEKYQAMQKRK